MRHATFLFPLLAALLLLPFSAPSLASSMPGAVVVGMAGSGALLAYLPEAGACTRLFRAWRNFQFEEDPRMDVCEEFMGINKYCADHDSFVAVGYDRDQTYRYLVCVPHSHPDSVGDQFVHIAKGLGEGIADAFVAAVPFVGEAISGAACVYGQIYACAVLALEISGDAGVPIAGVAGEAIGIAGEVSKCTDGDVVSCAKVGARGAKVAGLTIPGKDAAQVADDAQLCDDGDFAACMRLGKAASEAGGVPQGLGKGSFVDAQDCLAGSTQACAALGREAANAQAPMGGVPQGPQDLASCSGGNTVGCTHLGKSLAALSGPPRAVHLGRTYPSTPLPPPVRKGDEPMICAQARDARGRNSPVAPDLTAQCEAAGGDYDERLRRSVVTQGMPDAGAPEAIERANAGTVAPSPAQKYRNLHIRSRVLKTETVPAAATSTH